MEQRGADTCVSLWSQVKIYIPSGCPPHWVALRPLVFRGSGTQHLVFSQTLLQIPALTFTSYMTLRKLLPPL